MKTLTFLLCLIGAIISIMYSIKLVNQPNWLWNIAGVICLFLVGYSIAKTNCFTNFKKKRKNEVIN